MNSFGRDRKAAELALAEILKHRAVANATKDWPGLAEFTKPKTRKTFSEVAEDYLAERASLKYSTLRGYREVLKNYLLPAFGKMEVSDITEEDAARFQADVSKNVSAVRTNNIMGLLRYIMKVRLRRKLNTENPTVGVRQLSEKQPDIDQPTKEELALALSKIVPHYRPLFTCLAWTGARPNELFALRLKDIDFNRGEIRINKGRVLGSEDLPKSASSSRIVPMLSKVNRHLNYKNRSPLPTMTAMCSQPRTDNQSTNILIKFGDRRSEKLDCGIDRHTNCVTLSHRFVFRLESHPGNLHRCSDIQHYRQHSSTMPDSSKIHRVKTNTGWSRF